MKLGKMAGKTLAAGAAALAVVGMTASTANAGTTASVRGKGGGVYFYDRGDVLSVSDYRADGLQVEGILVLPSGKYITLFASGKDKHTEKKLGLKEGTQVHIRMCYVERDGSYNKCSDGKYGRA